MRRAGQSSHQRARAQLQGPLRAEVGLEIESPGSAATLGKLSVKATTSSSRNQHTAQPQGDIRESPLTPASSLQRQTPAETEPGDLLAIQAPYDASGIQLWGRSHQETPHLSDQLKTPIAPKASGEIRRARGGPVWPRAQRLQCGARRQARASHKVRSKRGKQQHSSAQSTPAPHASPQETARQQQQQHLLRRWLGPSTVESSAPAIASALR